GSVELAVWEGLGFFFSSRRRHTRLVSDWSSDVCSSDLAPVRCQLQRCREPLQRRNGDPAWIEPLRALARDVAAPRLERLLCEVRSEERRVGKEGGTRGWAAE